MVAVSGRRGTTPGHMDNTNEQQSLESYSKGLATVGDLENVWINGDLTNGSEVKICDVLEEYSQARQFPHLHDVIFQSIKHLDKIVTLTDRILVKYASCILNQSHGPLIEIWKQFLKQKKRKRIWFQLFTTFLQHFKVTGTSSSIPRHSISKLNLCIDETREKLSEKLGSDLGSTKSDWVMICYYFGEYLIIRLQDDPIDLTEDIGSKSWYDHSYLGVDYSWKLFYDQLALYLDDYGLQLSINYMLQKLRFLEIVALNRVNDEELVAQIEDKKREIVAHIMMWIREHPEQLASSVIEKIINLLDAAQMKELSKLCALQKKFSIHDVLINNQTFQSIVIAEVLEHFHSLTGSKIFCEWNWNGGQVGKKLKKSLINERVSEMHQIVLKQDSILADVMNKFFQNLGQGNLWSKGDCTPALNMRKCIALGCLTPLNQTRVMAILFSCLIQCEPFIQGEIIESILIVFDGFRAVWFLSVIDPKILLPKLIEQIPSETTSKSRDLSRTLFDRMVRRMLREDLVNDELFKVIKKSSGPGHSLLVSVLVQSIVEKEKLDLKKKMVKYLASFLKSTSEEERLDVLIGLLESDVDKYVIRNLPAIVEAINQEFVGELKLPSQQFLISAFKKRSLLGLGEEFVTNVFCKLIGIEDMKSDEPPKKKKKKRKKHHDSEMEVSFSELRKEFPAILANLVVISSTVEELQLLERLIIGRLTDECGDVARFRALQMAKLYASHSKNIRAFINELTPTIFNILSRKSDGENCTELQLVTVELLCSAVEKPKIEHCDLKLLLELSVLSLQQLSTFQNDVSKFCSFFSILDRIIRIVVLKYKGSQSPSINILITTSVSMMLKWIMKVMAEQSWSKYSAEQVKHLISCVQNLDRTICLFCSHRQCSAFASEFVASFILELQSSVVSKDIRPQLISILYRIIKTVDNNDQMNELEIVHARLNQSGKEFLRALIQGYETNYKYKGNV